MSAMKCGHDEKFYNPFDGECCMCQRNTLRAEVERLTAERDAATEILQEMYRYDHDIRIAQEEKIKQLESEITYLRSTDHAVDVAICTQEYDETPLGHALDGAGDEVE